MDAFSSLHHFFLLSIISKFFPEGRSLKLCSLLNKELSTLCSEKIYPCFLSSVFWYLQSLLETNFQAGTLFSVQELSLVIQSFYAPDHLEWCQGGSLRALFATTKQQYNMFLYEWVTPWNFILSTPLKVNFHTMREHFLMALTYLTVYLPSSRAQPESIVTYGLRTVWWSSIVRLLLPNTIEKLASVFQMVCKKNLHRVVFKSKTQENFAKKSYLISARGLVCTYMGRNF